MREIRSPRACREVLSPVSYRAQAFARWSGRTPTEWRSAVRPTQLRPAITINVAYAPIQFPKTFSVVAEMTKGRRNDATYFVSEAA